MNVKKRIRLYNTATKSKENLNQEIISGYTCGPTVYNPLHGGNIRPIIISHTLCNVLQYFGYQVPIWVMNFTDIDRKIYNEALICKKTTQELSSYYASLALSILAQLEYTNFSIVKTTDFLKYIEESIVYLQNNGYTFEDERGIRLLLSSITTEKQFELSHRSIDNTENNDFYLWRNSQDYFVPSNLFKNGIPGWHIECSGICRYLIHDPVLKIGGEDLIFPHHDNELMLSRLLGVDIVSWLHVSLVSIENKKMSKSDGNIIDAKCLLDKYGADNIKFFTLSRNFKSTLEFDNSQIIEFSTLLSKIRKYFFEFSSSYIGIEVNEKLSTIAYVNKFEDSISNNLNFQQFVSEVFMLLKKLRSGKYTVDNKPLLVYTIRNLFALMNISLYNI